MTNIIILIGKYVPYHKREEKLQENKDVRQLSQTCFTGNGEQAPNELNMESPYKVRYIYQRNRKHEEQQRHFRIELYSNQI